MSIYLAAKQDRIVKALRGDDLAALHALIRQPRLHDFSGMETKHLLHAAAEWGAELCVTHLVGSHAGMGCECDIDEAHGLSPGAANPASAPKVLRGSPSRADPHAPPRSAPRSRRRSAET